MTLPASGAISLNDINIELGIASGTAISLNDTAVRDLAGIPSGPISLNDFYGKASYDSALMTMPTSINVENISSGQSSYITWDSGDNKAMVYPSSGNTVNSPIINASENMSDYYVTAWFDPTQLDFTYFNLSGIPNNNLLSQSADLPFTVALVRAGSPGNWEGTNISGIITLKHVTTGTLKVCNVSIVNTG